MKRFNTIKGIEKYLRRTDKAPDFFKFKGIIYTMEKFDSKGEELNYRNKETTNGIYVFTKDRYNTGYKDAEVLFEENEGFYRNDITYMKEWKGEKNEL